MLLNRSIVDKRQQHHNYDKRKKVGIEISS